MYTYLNQKYGLKTLIVEWASSIIQAIKTYLHDDHDITLFAKILKNECDEGFRYVQGHVKDSLESMLRQVIRERFINKSEKEVAVEAELVTQSYIEEWQWKRIIQKMYEQEDANFLCQKLSDMISIKRETPDHKENLNGNKSTFQYFASQRVSSQKNLNSAKGVGFTNQAKKTKQNKKLTRDEEFNLRKQFDKEQKLVYSSDFLKTILDFQLLEHERFLYEFNLLFKQFDQDGDGIINEQEFHHLIVAMNVVVQSNAKQDVDTLLRVVDPHNNQHMTYSEVVTLLSNQLVPMQVHNSKLEMSSQNAGKPWIGSH